MKSIIEKLISDLDPIKDLSLLTSGTSIEGYTLNRDVMMRAQEAIDDARCALIGETMKSAGLEMTYRQRIDIRSRSMDDILDILDDADRWAEGV